MLMYDTVLMNSLFFSKDNSISFSIHHVLLNNNRGCFTQIEDFLRSFTAFHNEPVSIFCFKFVS